MLRKRILGVLATAALFSALFVVSCANPGLPDTAALSAIPSGEGSSDMAMGQGFALDKSFSRGSLSDSDIQSRATGYAAGVDVSYYQGSINWGTVLSAGKVFAFARISDGTGYVDPMFATYWPAMRSAGVVRGAYQFFRPAQDATAQANLFLSKLGTLASGDIPPVLDVEVTGGCSGSAIVSGIQTWVNIVKHATGKTPIIYTSPGFWSALPGTSSLSGCTLWVAHWGVSSPTVPSPWSSWKFWQYSDSGTVSGISGGEVDMDYFNGSLDQLKSWTGSSSGGTSPAPTPVPPASYPAPFTRLLQLTSPYASGSDVRLLQTLLNDWASATGRATISVDGSFGPATQSKVISFQSAYGLSADGMAGPATLGKLVTVFAQRSSFISPYYRTLSNASPMMYGSDVKAFQTAYNKWASARGYAALSVDGYYGPGSAAAASKFQGAETGILGTPDGMAGAHTQRLLFVRTWS